MRRLVLALLFLLVAAVLHPAPASAESGHRDKPVGDAPAAIDITGIDADNGVRRVRVRLTVPGLTSRGSFTVGYERKHYDGMAIEVRQRGGRVVRTAYHCGEDDCVKVRCRGIGVRWDEAGGYVAVSVPQRCYPLRVPRAWRFSGSSDLGDEYDSTYTKLELRRG